MEEFVNKCDCYMFRTVSLLHRYCAGEIPPNNSLRIDFFELNKPVMQFRCTDTTQISAYYLQTIR